MNDNDGLDTRLQHLYRQLPQQQPSSHIDQHILQAAKITRHWQQPFAVAATLVLTTSLVWYWQAQQPQQLQKAVAVAPTSIALPQEKTSVVISEPKLLKDEADDFAPTTNAPMPTEKKAKAQVQADTMTSELAELKENVAPVPIAMEELAKKSAASMVMAQNRAMSEQRAETEQDMAQTKAKRDFASSPVLLEDAVGSIKQELAVRTQQSIEVVFKKNHALLERVYLTDIKDKPNMQGDIRLKLSIDNSGKVITCEVVPNGLNHATLVANIVTLVKTFDFGEGEAWQGEYILNFGD